MTTGPRLRALPMLLLVAAAACGGGGETSSDREAEAARLVEARVNEVVTCRDTVGLDSELLPELPTGYSCSNEGGEFYNAIVSPDGVLTSLSGPLRLTPVGS